MSPAASALNGARVLVTRPAHQAETLCTLIEDRGGIALRCPTIEILPPRNANALKSIAEQLDQFDLAIFVSPNAVSQALAAIRLPPSITIAAIGTGSANALTQHGIEATLVPIRADSEGLLDLPAMQNVAGKRIVIFRGEDGRSTLGDTLRQRGADVTYAECYRRQRPSTDTRRLRDAVAGSQVDVAIVTSADALRNLHDMLGPDSASLTRITLIVVSERLREVCREFGLVENVRVAEGASDNAMIDALEAWQRARKTL